MYNHLVAVRQPDFDFGNEEPDFDWNSMSQKEMEEAFIKIDEASDKVALELERCQNTIPEYATSFLKKYLKIDNDKLGQLGTQKVLSIFNYLEFGFEVDFNHLEINATNGIIEFSTGNFPFGGLERFFITLKAFNMIPTECFDGFSVNEIQWESDFEYDFVELKNETEAYIQKFKS
ncbi:hypothetical protein PHEL85_2758 [Polaribacter sp. Hel1_85]|nr:hypothetical protein PHEL85_2758 [Polaribacter sp. Hel1_85]